MSNWIELLGGWCLGRRPKTSDVRHMVGSWAAKALLGFVVVEWVVQLGWNGHGTYNYLSNYVSDLGAIHCQDDGSPARYVCSPSFANMDLALIFIGASVIVTACLITSPALWFVHAGDLDQAYRQLRRGATDGKFRLAPPTRFARVWTTVVRWSLAITGLAIFIIGVIPEDYFPPVHDTAVFILLCGIVASLASIGVLWLRRNNASLWFFGLAIIAIVSALAMGLTGGSTPYSGLFERGVIYSFILGMAILGFMVSAAARHERNGQLQPRPAGQLPWGARQADHARAAFVALGTTIRGRFPRPA
ncbi:hypothetical protein RBS60_04255 [Sinomonas sp. ASV486]|uniref:hypothetical protein n=1 Tax=Sinomonas sp. ASV486 TaxID=3051170 RepID=UPI0027DE1FDB|nr:hypothetical protein [Sinomonas sp. ASV486]MDQ4489410.1 hypothetical protein [Sinomonas sp. ASV486]